MVQRGVDYTIPASIVFVRVDEATGVLSFPRFERNKLLEGASVDLVEAAVSALREGDGETVSGLAAALPASDSKADAILAELDRAGALARAEAPAAPVPVIGAQPIDREETPWPDITIGVLGADRLPVDEATTVESLSDPSDVADCDADAVVSLTTGVEPTFHRDVLERVVEREIPWVPARLVDGRVRLGPATVPGTSGCYGCYVQRRRASRRNGSLARAVHAAREGVEPSYHPSVRAVARGLLVGRTHAVLSDRRRARTVRSVVTVDPATGDRTTNEFLRVPTCERCGRN